MAAREPTLPEGTDSIIDTNTDIGGSTSGLGGTGGSGGPDRIGAGDLGGGTTTTSATSTTGGATSPSGGAAFQFDKDGGGSSGNTGTSRAAESIVGQLKDQVSNLKGQAGDRARSFADDGKRQATDLLGSIAQVLEEAAGSVENRLGSQYAGFGNRAADAVSSFSSRIDEKSIDELIEDARDFVQRSPAIAIGIAALVGFAVARVVRSGVTDLTGAGTDSTSAGTSATAGTGTGSGSAGTA